MRKTKYIGILIASLFILLSISLYISAESPEYTPYNTGVYDGHTYMLFHESVSWDTAVAYCESLGGHLVTISSQEENDFIMSLCAPEEAYLLGMHRNITGWDTWITGEPVTYSHWAPQQPDNLNGKQTKCLIVNYYDNNFGITPSFWDDVNDENDCYFICELEYAHDPDEGLPFTYTVNEDGTTATITGYTDEPSGDLVIPEMIDGYTVTAIGETAFQNCTGFTGTLTIPDSVVSIGGGAFIGCTGLTGSLTIPDSVTVIGDGAFMQCSGFNGTLTLSDSLTSIGDYAFAYCSGFTGTLLIPDSVTYLGEGTFALCSGFTGTVHVPKGVSVLNGTFSGCSGLTGTLTIPENITSISLGAFNGCTGLTGSLTFPDTVTSLGSSAFMGCSGFTDLTIPESVTSVASYAFRKCSSLETITFQRTTPPSFGGEIFVDTTALTAVYVPAESYDAYVTALTDLLDTSLIVKSEAEPVGPFTYTVNEDGTTATITGYTDEPSGDLVIPETIDGYTVTAIGETAFQNCTGFTGTLTIPDSVVSIGGGAFSGCTGLTGSLTIPDSVTVIGDVAFTYCTGFDGTLTLSDNLTSIGIYAFMHCSGFNGTLTLSDSLTSIGDYAFLYCSGFTGTLLIPDSVTYLGEGTFCLCSGFTGTVHVPKGVSVLNGTFSGCSGLTGTLTIPENITSISQGAFNGCTGLTGSLTFPDTVTSLGSSAFMGCTGFTDLTIPESVTSVASYAFRECSSLETITFQRTTPPSFGGAIFDDTTALTAVYVPAESYDAYVTALTDLLDTSLIVKSEPVSPFTYTVNEDGETITITDYNGSEAEDLVIPTEIDGYTVTAIGAKAFENGAFTTVTIPDTIASIGYAAFSGCTSLAKITFCGQFPTIGSETDGTDIFTGVTAEARYPSNHAGWTSSVLLQYGGTITWTPYTLTYEIADAEALYRFAELVNSGSYNLDGVLTADITVNEKVLKDDGTLIDDTTGLRSWEPIVPESNNYTGKFNGNNHVISGLYCVQDSVAGLFGRVRRTDEVWSIRDLTIKDSYFQANNAASVVVTSMGCISNCTSYATVVGSRAAGICAYIADTYQSSSTIQKCRNYGHVSGTYEVGGIVGRTDQGEHITYVNYSANYGTVTGTGTGHTGGIVGYSMGVVGINYCANLGNVSGTGTVAGIAAHLNRSTVSSCSSTGTGVNLLVASNNNGSISGYYLSDEEIDDFSGTTAKTLKEYYSGEVAYLLRIGMGQTIGTDNFPTPEDDKVYKTVAASPCTGYTNNPDGIKQHEYDENGICIWCSNVCIGDINGDTVVDQNDLDILKRYFAGFVTEEIDPEKADINRDGKFTRADVMFLARCLAEWDGYTLP